MAAEVCARAALPMWHSLPQFGTAVLYAVLIAAAYTFAVSLVASRGRPRHLAAARLGAYGTVALVGLGVLVLAYAFVTHDFRIRYVARYSDRSMSLPYLLTSLWGGQDGSLLWWLLLLGIYTAACVRWMKGRFRELQPWVIATLMVIVSFFAVLMMFAANPFETSVSGARLDGEGLNPLLQNFYMIIHPPSLYTGFVGCSVPFAFAIAALATGRLDSEWIVAVRKWMLFAWLFLSIGNTLGMLWAYEELGWGGFWAWDPVENAACLPWFTATAYVHSTMIQERRGMLKVWNVVLVATTFFLTIYGTFLTRSGLIASVHSFAQSGIGTYFLWFLGFAIATTLGLLVWRLPLLRSAGAIESTLSREAAFVLNNWMLLGIAVFILTGTTFPVLSEWLLQQKSTVGPSFYNAWLPAAGMTLFFLMGLTPLLGWRKTSPQRFRQALVFPVAAALATLALHVAFGARFGFPPVVLPDRIYDGKTGAALQRIDSFVPVVATVLAAFNLAVVLQEFSVAVRARMRSGRESAFVALARVVARARRRYGGYVVHVGIGFMMLGFVGKAWSLDRESALRPGESMQVDHYRVTYTGPRMEVDVGKRMVFADLDVADVDGRHVGKASPAKFIYRKMPESPTTEVAMLHSIRDDIYVVVGSVSPETKVATFQVHVNTLVSWIWIGALILIAGAAISLWPEPVPGEARAWSWLRFAGATGASVMLAFLLAMAPAQAFAQTSSSLHAGTVHVEDPKERELFGRLLCMCGGCARLPLLGCVCDFADQARSDIRARLASGATAEQIVDEYVGRYGSSSLAVPPNRGGLRAVWLLPTAILVAGGAFAVVVVRRWKQRGAAAASAAALAHGGEVAGPADEWDAKIDDELRRLDDER